MQLDEAYLEFAGLLNKYDDGVYKDVEILESGWVKATETHVRTSGPRLFSPHMVATIIER